MSSNGENFLSTPKNSTNNTKNVHDDDAELKLSNKEAVIANNYEQHVLNHEEADVSVMSVKNVLSSTVKTETDKEPRNIVASPPLPPPPPPPPPPPTPIVQKKHSIEIKKSAHNLESKNPFNDGSILPSVSSNKLLPGRLYSSNSVPFLDAINLKKILSTRPSTPFTQATPHNSVRFDLNKSIEYPNFNKKDPRSLLKQDKFDALSKGKYNSTRASQSVPSLPTTLWHSKDGIKDNACYKSKSVTNTSYDANVICYSRSRLLSIRNALVVQKHVRKIINCDEIELEARLKRFYIWRNPYAQTTFPAKKKFNNNFNNIMSTKNTLLYANAMVSEIFQPQIIDDSIIKSKPPQQPVEMKETATIGKKHRYFGSGRLTNSFTSITQQNYNSHKTVHNLSETSVEDKLNAAIRHSVQWTTGATTKPINDNTNYVKSILSNYLTVSHEIQKQQQLQIKKEAEENSQNNTKDEEPEWYSCGPTSRLDTIELTGFTDDMNDIDYLNEKGIHTENQLEEFKENNTVNKFRYDENSSRNNNFSENGNDIKAIATENNESNVMSNGNGCSKTSIFPCDQFNHQSQCNNYQSTNQLNNNNSNNCSKFLPYFNSSNQNAPEQLEQHIHSCATIEKFFKNALPHQLQIQQQQQRQQHFLHQKQHYRNKQTEIDSKLSNDNNNNNKNINNNMLKEMALVDDLEMKWRQNSAKVTLNATTSTNNDSGNNSVNNDDTKKSKVEQQDAENFRNLIKQLSADGGQIGQLEHLCNSTIQQQQQALQQNQINEFVQQQQQQAAILNPLYMNETLLLLQQMQLKNILSRPESQALIIRLIKGDISKYWLTLQLSNPNLSQREREAIIAVLTFIATTQQQQHQQQFNVGQSFQTQTNNNHVNVFLNSAFINQWQNIQNLAKLQQALIAQQQQQNGNNLVIPMTKTQQQSHLSYEELQTHANWIMQNALMKRRIKEQQSNAMNMQRLWQSNSTIATQPNRKVDRNLTMNQPNNAHFQSVTNNNNEEYRRPIFYSNARNINYTLNTNSKDTTTTGSDNTARKRFVTANNEVFIKLNDNNY